MENNFKVNYEFRNINEPSDTLKEHYARLYKRNQQKFIRRSKLEPEHLGLEFGYDDKTLKLIGSLDSILMVVLDVNENKYYRVHSDVVTDGILKGV
jgi:hypothetical protein